MQSVLRDKSLRFLLVLDFLSIIKGSLFEVYLMMTKKTKQVLWFSMLGLLFTGFSGLIFFTSIDGKGSLFSHFSPNIIHSEDQNLDITNNNTLHTVADDSSKWDEEIGYEDLFVDATSQNSFDDLGEQIAFLEKNYKKNPNAEIFELLVHAYLLNNQFDDAKLLVYGLTSQEQETLDQKLLFKIVLHSFSQTNPAEYELLVLLADKLYEEQKLPLDEYQYYQLLFSLSEGNYAEISGLVEALADTHYASFIQQITKNLQTFESFDKVAEYYLDGLMAHSLMNEGYFALAKKLALPILIEHPNYILPQQIMAYANFATHDYARAVEYFSQLLELDYQKKNVYLYYLGVAYYHLENYTESVVYLAQITDVQYLLDADRFLVLSYLKLWDQTKALHNWKRLFNHKNIKESDFYTFYQEAFWNFYLHGESSRYLQKDPELVKLYLSSCGDYVPSSSEVCTYGELGALALSKQYSKVDQAKLTKLAGKYQKPEFYLLLWEIYLINSEDTEQAIGNFMRALRLSSDPLAQNYLKEKILLASGLEE